jgi:hypothetical protein
MAGDETQKLLPVCHQGYGRMMDGSATARRQHRCLKGRRLAFAETINVSAWKLSDMAAGDFDGDGREISSSLPARNGLRSHRMNFFRQSSGRLRIMK